VRLRAEHKNHVWSYDFVSAKTHDGRTVRMLNLIDEYTRECLMIRCERSWPSAKVIGALADVMVMKGVPGHLRSDNGPEVPACPIFCTSEIVSVAQRVIDMTRRRSRRGCGKVESVLWFPLFHTPATLRSAMLLARALCSPAMCGLTVL
jgi:hypothetical protein